jgi:hypothetical protein
MSLPTLDDLLSIPTKEEAFDDEVIPEQIAQGVQVTSWAPGEIWRTASWIIARLYSLVRAGIAAIAAGGFEDYAFGFATVTNPLTGIAYDLSGWAPLIAKQRYGLDQILAQPTKRTITFTNASATPYGPLTAGSVIVQYAASGRRYVLDETVTIAGSTTTAARFKAEIAGGAANGDATSSAVQLVTAQFPGVTAAATAVVALGRDAETPQELGARCRGLIPLLAAPKDPVTGNVIPISPTASGYEALARTASDQVKICSVYTSATINNQVDIVCAGQGAPLDGPTVDAIQDYVDHFTMITDYPVVSTPTSREVNIRSGVTTVKVTAALLASAKIAMQTAIEAYFGGTDPTNVITVNPLVERAYLCELIRATPGVTYTDAPQTLEIGHNGGSYVADDLQLPITPGAFEMASWSEDVATLFTWMSV